MGFAAITGHTSGIGESIFNHLQKKDWQVSGFARSNGFDIRESQTRSTIIQETKDCNIFVNNAHAGFSQTELFFELFDFHKDNPNLHIINIGVGCFLQADWAVVDRAYPAQKASLLLGSDSIQNQERKCRVTTLSLGHIDTLSNKAHSGPKLQLSQLNETIDYIINLPVNMEIRNLSLWPR